MNIREFSRLNIDKDCKGITGDHVNELFFNCEFDNLRGLTLKHCVLNKSRFITDSIKSALGFTLTLDCHSFKGVSVSELVFDLILCLLTMTIGNDSKREALKDVVGQDRYKAIMRVLKRVE